MIQQEAGRIDGVTLDVRPVSRARLPAYFAVAWAVSLVTTLSVLVTIIAVVNVRATTGLTFQSAVISFALTAVSHASGAYVLGTLIEGMLRPWPAAFVFIFPGVLLRAAIFALAFSTDAGAQEVLSQPGNLIAMPIAMLLAEPFVSRFFITIGEGAASEKSRANAVLNVPWYHVVWALPLYLFQVVGVPTFLLLTLWKIDSLSEFPSRGWSWLFDLPSLIPRILVLIMPFVVIASIGNVYSAVSSPESGLKVAVVLKCLGNWMLLTVMEAFVLLVAFGRLHQAT